MCRTCKFGKLIRQPFPLTSLEKAKDKLELVHLDVCSLMDDAAHASRRYFIIFINDYSRKC